ncbi:MAG TPA: hypothetical protein VGD97_05700 [Lacunisphaera sp.]
MRSTIPITILGALLVAACVALFIARRDNARLEAQLTRLSRQNAGLRYDLKQATRQATAAGQRAVELDSQLGSAKVRTTATETRNRQLVRQLTEREQREVALMAELAALRRPDHSASPTGESTDQTATLNAGNDSSALIQRIAELEDQLTQLLTRALAESLPEPAESDAANATLPHQVVRVGPAAAFVVLDYGTEHGAQPRAIIRLRRGTSELAQVQISDVRPRFSLAQVLPGTLKGQLQTGDLVVFTQ